MVNIPTLNYFYTRKNAVLIIDWFGSATDICIFPLKQRKELHFSKGFKYFQLSLQKKKGKNIFYNVITTIVRYRIGEIELFSIVLIVLKTALTLKHVPTFFYFSTLLFAYRFRSKTFSIESCCWSNTPPSRLRALRRVKH